MPCLGLQRRRDSPQATEPDGLIATYRQVVGLSKLSSVRSLCLVLMTVKVAFAPADSVATFKLQEYGMPKADIATYSPISLVIGLFLPAFMSSIVAADPISVVRWGIPEGFHLLFILPRGASNTGSLCKRSSRRGAYHQLFVWFCGNNDNA